FHVGGPRNLALLEVQRMTVVVQRRGRVLSVPRYITTAEPRIPPRLSNSFRRCNKRVGRADDLTAGPYARCAVGESLSVGPPIHTTRPRVPTNDANSCSKARHLSAPDESCLSQSSTEGGYELFFQEPVRRDEIENG